ncbi:MULTISPECIES: helix-turn-helix domain-containing protein [unclassified Amycolatopsis]|uniref:helix-turn-helix domain-containing protein n=1 Tax=unclassified Amycolatopsis TaxID=2618356 RepID=UPI002E10E8ED|nr:MULTISPECIES: helix-turn-helix domain-containing protein [unclassified Amycolatopsis]WSJ72967.1 helix-turn-helix transcriptional regulator [Amycolatopsis sp. NBC_01307]WSK83306.1 helix-turn-helix transcriptional regulator [Amycolatopsis sp. NBC_01286]
MSAPHTRTYGQFCGIARALELVGERWSLLIIRDLVLGAKRYDELQAGLPKIPPSILSARLNDLEAAGVLRRRVRAELDAGLVYELTQYGSELDHIVLDLGLWGARSLNAPKADEVFTLDAAILSLYTTFRSDAAENVQINFEIRYDDRMIVHALVENGAVKVGEGRFPGAELVIEAAAGTALLDLMSGRLTAADATRTGKLGIEGAVADLEMFAQLFHIPAAPEPATGIVVR